MTDTGAGEVYGPTFSKEELLQMSKSRLWVVRFVAASLLRVNGDKEQAAVASVPPDQQQFFTKWLDERRNTNAARTSISGMADFLRRPV